MRYRRLFVDPRTSRRVRLALIGVWSGFGLLAGTWCFLAFKHGSAAQETVEQTKALRSKIAEASAAIERAKGASEAAVPRGLAIIDAFQAAATQVAAQNNCSLAEFQATPQLSAYLSRFKKTTPKVEWVQVDVTAVLRGAAPNVVETLKGLAVCGVPFEFNTVDLKRDASSDTKAATVTCTLSLRLVTHNEGGKA